MPKGSVKRGLPSRFEAGEVARSPTGFVLLQERGHNHYRNPRWKAAYLLRFSSGWHGGHTVKESDLTKVIWTFTGFVEQPSERR